MHDAFNDLLRSRRFESAAALVEARAASAGSAELDAVALAVARSFMEGTIDFDTASGIVAELWRAKFESGVPALTAEIYWAFDSGEYGNSEREADDPVNNATKPALAAIISRHRA